jgi:DNA (cytosine-5)-methyltransferase 1
MRVGSLFSGIGGIDLGLERAGMRVVWQVECDPFCVNVLERHWPAVHRRRDVRLATAANLGPCDLVAGGFPCQDISAAGKGAGIERGHRSGLWREFARLVGELRPCWVLVENVPALRRRGGDIVLGDLEAQGYACGPLVVGARHVGAPHRRDRVWIVGRRLGDGHGPGVEGWRLPPCERAHEWPSRPSSSPHAWEPPRTVKPPVGRRAHGVSARLASARWRNELRALGNAVVPQVVEVIGRAILAVEGHACRRRAL